ncbi:DinB family protein [Danxiaibacter flavus]|uniref:DinB family protein n=1 Tax=Danxiaibacter flavus TaxID=3049108 RepID=A0ABV3ZIJ0_9BACT|nr:DinB family protein [Chitinophagaceae bacterium DXS]
MLTTLKHCLWKNFAASIDMLKNAIEMCPDELWYNNKKFFYNAYHCAVFTDYYLTIPPVNFFPPPGYTLTEPDKIPADAVDDVVPNKLYSRAELIDYVQYAREKCRSVISNLTEEKLNESWIASTETTDLSLSGMDALKYSILEILFYNLRHVQHHAAQLNFMLRQAINAAPDYVSQAEDDL